MRWPDLLARRLGAVGVSTTGPYDGRSALQATSTVAPLGEWRTVSLRDTRLHVNLSGNAPVIGISVSVRVEGSADSGLLSFRVDDVGWTGVRDG